MARATFRGLLRRWFPSIGRFGAGLAAIVLFCLATIWLIYAWIADTSYRGATTDSSLFATGVAHRLAADLERTVAFDDQILSAVVAAAADGSRLSPDLERMVRSDRSATATPAESILLADSEGNVVADTRSDEETAANVAEHDYFQALARRGSRALYVSQVFKAPTGPMIALSRRLEDQDGRFMGIIVRTMDVGGIAKRLAEVKMPQNSLLTLASVDGTIIAEAGEDPEHRTQPSYPMPPRLSQQGTYTTQASPNASEALVAYNKVGDLPLVVSAALSTDEILKVVRAKMEGTAAGFIVLSATVLALALILGHELHRRALSEKTFEALAATDKLTGLANRRRFDDVLETAFDHAIDGDHALGLMLIDIDFFKAFNDRYGHQAGDETLRCVAQVLPKTLQPAADPVPLDGALAARIGGEEFAILLPEADMVAALAIAARVMRAVSHLDRLHAGSPIGSVTVSIGVACRHRGTASDPAALIAEADKALYLAKAKGRNRIETLSNADAPDRRAAHG